MTQPPKEGPQNPTPERPATLIETDEDIRQALRTGAGKTIKGQTGEQREAVAGPGGGRTASPFRPTARPPVALLTVHDDGKTEGELIRIRDSRFIIGRSEGDLRIPHDGRISSRHVEITRQQVGGLYRWVVTDLQSTNGLFVRISRTPLADRSEFLVGNGRYRFEGSRVEASDTVCWFSVNWNSCRSA